MNLVTPSLVETDYSLWQKIMETNLGGTFLCSKKAAGIMKEQKRGKIINLSSIVSSYITGETILVDGGSLAV